MKKYISLILTCVMLVTVSTSVYADTSEKNEWYDLVEEEFCVEDDIPTIGEQGIYIMGVQPTLAKLGSDKLGIRADVYCASVVTKIQIDYTLEKKSGSSWTVVGRGTVYDYNVSSTGKSVTASGVAKGTYRAGISVKVTDKQGYSETAKAVTGSLVLS